MGMLKRPIPMPRTGIVPGVVGKTHRRGDVMTFTRTQLLLLAGLAAMWIGATWWLLAAT